MASVSLVDKNIVVVGMGLTGLSCVQFLLAQGANVTAMDSRSELSIKVDVPLYLGEFDAAKLYKADLVVVSPGVSLQTPAIQQAVEAGVSVIGDIELFARFNTLPVIAITGSNGKSTVTHLVVEMCKAAGMKVLMGGNIGVPALDLLEQTADIVVLELSSFQLETTQSLKPLAATILNFCDDHLDRHGNMQNYQRIKHLIYHNAKYVVASRDEVATQPIKQKMDLSFGLSASTQGFSWDKSSATILLDAKVFLKSSECLLVGAHNMLNIQAAAGLALLAGVDVNAVKQGAKSFGGLAHRCQTVSMLNGVRWINDSKATNVGATQAAIQGIAENCQGRLVLIAGGEGKGADFSPLADLLKGSVDLLITLGKDGDKIAALKSDTVKVVSLEQAVKVAFDYAQPQDIVMLSPACASLDMFNNYQHRGECFIKAVQALSL